MQGGDAGGAAVNGGVNDATVNGASESDATVNGAPENEATVNGGVNEATVNGGVNEAAMNRVYVPARVRYLLAELAACRAEVSQFCYILMFQ